MQAAPGAGAQVVESACADVPVSRNEINADGVIDDERIRARIAAIMRELAAAARVPLSVAEIRCCRSASRETPIDYVFFESAYHRLPPYLVT